MRLLPVQARVEAQEARLAEIELERDRYRLVAPITGRVGRIAAGTGQWCMAGTPVVTIVAPLPQRMTREEVVHEGRQILVLML